MARGIWLKYGDCVLNFNRRLKYPAIHEYDKLNTKQKLVLKALTKTHKS